MRSMKNRKVHGSVLLTVVAVMSLLIIFMVSTLTLATAANNRSHANYSGNQAEYTARTAIDSFTQAMARNNAVAQAVVSLESGKTLEPTVVIERPNFDTDGNVVRDANGDPVYSGSNDTALGRIGYYNNANEWQNNKIRVERLDDVAAYDAEKGEWRNVPYYRIVATARVGKETKTVTAYMRSKLQDEQKPPVLKGFRTTGNAGFTTTKGYVSGALCMGITDNTRAPYKLSNGTTLDTDQIFVNGGLEVAGNNIEIYASRSDDDEVSNTVILGDLTSQNDLVIHVDYPYAKMGSSGWEYKEMSQKNIPYLYVDGKLDPTNGFHVLADGVNTPLQLASGSPYNIFCGQFDGRGNSEVRIDADMYIMKEGSSLTSHIGCANNTTLYSWSNSVLNRTGDQFASCGGSVYANHNIDIQKATIRGNLVVNGNCNIGENVRIDGDLVVLGKVTGKTNLGGIVGGTAYIGDTTGLTATGLRAGYFAKANNFKANDLKLGYKKVQNVERGSVEVKNATVMNTVHSNKFVENKQQASYLQNGEQLVVLQNDLYPEDQLPKVMLKQQGNGFGNGTVYIDGWQQDAKWEGNPVNANVIYRVVIDGKIYNSTVYIDKITGAATENPYSYAYVESVNEDGTPNYAAAPDNVAIFRADKDGNMTNEQTTDAYTIYVVDPLGNVTDTRTTDLYQYYKTTADSNDEDMKFRLDSSGNYEKTDKTAWYAKRKPITTSFSMDSDGVVSEDQTEEILVDGNPVETDTWSYYIEIDATGKPVQDSSSNSGFKETNEPIKYYVADKDGNISGDISTSHTTYYKADVNGNATSEVVTTEFTYYDGSGNEVSAGDAQGNANTYVAWYDPNVDAGTEAVYYYDEDPTGHEGDASWLSSHKKSSADAYTNSTVKNVTEYSGYRKIAISQVPLVEIPTVYPQAMTKEALTGTKMDGGSPDTSNKVVKTLKDVQQEIGYNEATMSYTGVNYYTDVPNARKSGDTYVGFDYITVNSNNTYNINSNTVVKTGSTSAGPVTININPMGKEIWVVLDNCSFESAQHQIICSSNGTVNFLVKGNFSFNGNGISGIFTKKIYDQLAAGKDPVVREDDKLNIYYYGTKDSSINCPNQVLLCGVAFCPYTSYSVGSQALQKTFTYISKSGHTTKVTTGVNWVGNALFGDFPTSMNNFAMLYTDYGQSGGGGTVYNGALGEAWKILNYDIN